MATSLDDMLEPGERVVYRTGTGRTVRRVLVILFGMAALLWGLSIVLSAVAFKTVAWVFFALVGATAGFASGIWLQPGPAIVTERRLLYDRGFAATLWSWQRRFAIPLAEIVELEGFERGWRSAPRLILADGRVHQLGGIPHPERLAEAIAAARRDA